MRVQMDQQLRETAMRALEAAPCSIEIPAGTGKTQLLAAAATVAAEQQRRSLVLTHTNAGVEAIRRRLRVFGVDASSVRVETITSWAFSLARAYSDLAHVIVPEIPDWTKSTDYVTGAARVASARAVQDVLKTSFDVLLVDEYQDCTVVHHEFVEALTDAIPTAILLGDRLQAVFGFLPGLTDWDTHVTPRYPSLAVPIEPHRWHGHNEGLGQWLLDIRPSLVEGRAFDISEHSVPGLTWTTDPSPISLATIARGFRDFDETVLLVDKWAGDTAIHASRLGGSYSVLEDVAGRFMASQLSGLPQQYDPRLAWWLAGFAKECLVGLSGIDRPVLQRLEHGEPITHYRRSGLEPVLAALEALQSSPTYVGLGTAARSIRPVAGVRPYRWEAWNDSLSAIAMTAQDGEPVLENLGKLRERLRRSGRRSGSRIAATPLLVKGLEFDHVIIANLSKLTDPRILYVAMSRARKSVIVVGSSTRVMLSNEQPRRREE